jgi:hypothetical protein
VFTGNRFSELLQGPRGRGVRRHIHMQYPAAPDFHHDKNIKDAEAKRHGDHEIAGYDSSCMVPHEGHPALGGRASLGAWILWPIGSHGSWRYPDTELESQFRCDPRLTPGGILAHHFGYEYAQILRQSRSATARLPTPEKLKCPLMPTDERLRFHDNESVPPIEPPRPEKQREPGRVGQPVGLDVSFSVERELFPEEKVLSD